MITKKLFQHKPSRTTTLDLSTVTGLASSLFIVHAVSGPSPLIDFARAAVDLSLAGLLHKQGQIRRGVLGTDSNNGPASEHWPLVATPQKHMHKPSLNTTLELSTVTGAKLLIDFAMAAIAKQNLAMRACSTNKVR